MWGRTVRRFLVITVAVLAGVLASLATVAHPSRVPPEPAVASDPDTAAPGPAPEEPAQAPDVPAAGAHEAAATPSDRLVVRTAGLSDTDRTAAFAALGVVHETPLGNGWSRLDVDGPVSADTATAALAATGVALDVEADLPIWAPAAVPDDTHVPAQWGLEQASDADIDAPSAWDVTKGSASVTIAVIDTGFDIDHPDLDGHVWTNPGESGGGKETNGADDDGNGYVDDVHGWDWWNDDNSVYDTADLEDNDSHGTHVAGVIAAETDNGQGIAGVCWNCKLMPLKFLGATGGYTSDAILAINYAVAEGAKVINASWGGSSNSAALKQAVDDAGAAGVVVVAAAGNSGTNSDVSPHYPSSFTSSNLISVAATSADAKLASFSTYGPTSVDIGAPGESVLSTLPGNSYGYYSGTSMATPHVAGAAALLASTGVTAVSTIRSYILDSAQPWAALAGKVATSGVLNLNYALRQPLAATSGRYHALAPSRLLDTRNGTGMPGGAAAAIGQRGSAMLKVTGVGGVPASGVGAVVLNVTVTQPSASGHLTVFPAGSVVPTASNLNFSPGQTIPNSVIARVGAGGEIGILNSAGASHVVVDVNGWFGDDGNPAGGAFEPLSPARLLDTRSGNGRSGALGSGQSFTLEVAGRGGVPETDVSGVVLNVTATQPTQGSFVTVWPAGESRPTASNLNFTPGRTIANHVMVGLGDGGDVSFFNNYGTVHLVADVVGYFTPETDTTGARYHALSPYRALDTRTTNNPIGTQGVDVSRTLTLAGVGGVPASGVLAVVTNTTATQPQGAGFLTVWPAGGARPTASNLNFTPGQTIPNLVTAKLSGDGKVDMATNGGSVQVIYDIAGYYS